MSKEKFIPLAEVAIEEVPHLDWQLELPEWVDANKIGINVGGFGRIARMGGMDEITIAGYDGELLSTTPEIVGMDSTGSAMAGLKATTVKTPTFKTSMDDEYIPSWQKKHYDYYRPDAFLEVNTTQIQDTLSSKKSNALRDPKAWATQLDQATKAGLKDLSKVSLVSAVPIREMASEIMSPLGYSVGLAASATLHHESGAHILGSLAVVVSSWQLMWSPFFAQLHGDSFRERKWSIVPIVHPDRLLAVHAMARTTRLVKPPK